MAAEKKVLRYLQSSKKIPLKWCAIDNALPVVIHDYADASFPDIPDTHLSSIGYVFLVNGFAISKWASTSTVRRSSTKTVKLLSLSLKRHASEGSQNTLPFVALYSRTSRPSGSRPQGHPPTSHKDACGHIRITSCRTNLHRVSRSHSRTPVRVRG
jgi:hypothetical protein